MKSYGAFSIVASAMFISAAIPCPEGINLLPRYGRAKKCPAQLKADQTFISQVERQYGSREKGAENFIESGWTFLKLDQPNAAMKRFNQEWLLDSTNAQLDWGFGSALGMQEKNESSLVFFRTAIPRNAKNSRVWRDAAISYGNVWNDTKRIVYLDTAIIYLKRSIALNGEEAYIYAELAKAYHFYPQADSAKKYLAIADGINPTQVDWRIRELIIKQEVGLTR